MHDDNSIQKKTGGTNQQRRSANFIMPCWQKNTIKRNNILDTPDAEKQSIGYS